MALLLTGRPGVGKTTALRAAGQRLGGFRLAGFYTEDQTCHVRDELKHG